jgi:hypothetical protein
MAPHQSRSSKPATPLEIVGFSSHVVSSESLGDEVERVSHTAGSERQRDLLTKTTPQAYVCCPPVSRRLGLVDEGDTAGGDVVNTKSLRVRRQPYSGCPPVSRRLGLVDEGDGGAGDVVNTKSLRVRRQPYSGCLVHEEGLEPPHLAVPEPKS